MESKDMEKFKTYAKIAAAGLVVAIVAPVVALFGLTMLGLAFGTSILMTAGLVVMAWRHQKAAEARTENQSETPSQAKTQAASAEIDVTQAQPA
jgi:flagellar biosynthesis component FlhA